MAIPKVPAFRLSEDSQQRLLSFYKECRGITNKQYNIRDMLLQADRTYMREVDRTEEQWKARQANRAKGDPTKFQNQIIPVVMPQVEAATTYQTSVFCTGYPIFGIASVPEYADEALMLETILGEQQIRGKWIAELIKLFRNGFKYNLAAMEADWAMEVTYSIQTQQETGSRGTPEEILWQGNKLKTLDMYNTFWDTRVSPEDVPEYGEFAGYTELMSRIKLKKFIAGLASKINVREAFESGDGAPYVGTSGGGYDDYFIPFLNPNSLVQNDAYAGTNWLAWAGMENSESRIRYSNMYKVTTLYARILPDDFTMKGAVAPNTPQVWKLHIVNEKVIIYAERLTNAHGLIPIFFYQPLNDGLGYQTKSFADNVTPIQEIMTALANSSIAGLRRGVADRMIYDPSRISPAAINNESANAKIPVRPSAYQTELSRAVYQIPFNDTLFQYNQANMQFYSALGNQISGLNPARQGQFVKGNKTRTEFQSTMDFANGRDEAIALSTEGSFFTPLKEVLKLNILQYQPGVSLFNRERNQVVQVDPIRLRQASLVFQVSDGRTPSDKLLDLDSLTAAMQTIASVPQLGQAYNLAPMFSYLMKMRGAKLQPFEKTAEQLAYEQALGTWQQAAQQIGLAIQEAAKNAEPKMTPEQLQELANQLTQANPMPKPEDFNFDPAKPTLSKQSAMTPNVPGILESMQQTASSAAQQAQGPAGQAALQ